MTPAPLPPGEPQRLAALQDCALLDTPPEKCFDDLAQLASCICGVPIALISLVDSERQWFKSKIGIEATETPRDIAFCGHVILHPEVMVVNDALRDERFHDNPLVTGSPGVRFYAGAPLEVDGGLRLGTLCVIDTVPRELSDVQRDALAALARQVVAQIELRRKVIALQEAGLRQSLFEKQLQRFNDEMMALVTLRTRELQRERDRAELYFDIAGNMMVVADLEGRIERANRKAGEVLCRPDTSLQGKDWFELCFPEDERVEARHFFHKLIVEDNKSEQRFRGRLVTADGRFRTIAWHTTRLVDEQGRIKGLLGVGEDITGRLEAEDHLRRTLDELERSNMGLQQFVHVASHDLREPINSILNFARLLVRDRDSANAAVTDRYINYILRGGERLRMLVDDLLAFVRIENSEPRMERVELDEAVEETRQALADAIERSGARISVGSLPAIRGDRTLIGLLLQNLISNAIKFRRPGESPEITVSANQDGEAVRICVTDNGIGVAESYHEKIFGVFQRLHSRSEYEGTGLGLALSRRVADIHSAHLSVVSRENEGSCFVLALPLSSLLPATPTRVDQAITA
ncbi:MAG: PAS domain S-box protein [Methyloversatilis sp.]|nr:PAS domain S-box protein [Methyloversatilis sp.]MBP6193905.1 PAS domain S-box protein [Methyloversatilis sp.]